MRNGLLDNIKVDSTCFIVKSRDEYLKVEEWGDNSVRIVSKPHATFNMSNEYGIEELVKNKKSNIDIIYDENMVLLKNNHLTVRYDGEKLSFYYKNQLVLSEFCRQQSNVRRTIGVDDDIPIADKATSSLNIFPREFVYKSENSYNALLRFEGDENEKIYGLGGYQEKNLNKNGGVYELMQRNSQTSIPFYYSNKNYGFIWNNASIGEVVFGKNQKIWKANNTNCIDYIVTVGETPKTIISNFTEMTGRSPVIAKNLLGLWQSKLRYQTTKEVEDVFDLYQKKSINLSVLVIDYFHWTEEGDFEFDMKYWKNIDKLSNKLNQKGTNLMVSLWPTISKNSKYYEFYQNNQLVIKDISGKDEMFGDAEILDFSNPMAREHLRKLLNKNYRSLGIKLFWADQAEPEMDKYHHSNYLLHFGNMERYGNKYPYYYLNAIQNDDLKSYNKGLPTLIRSAWFNSQKYGALAWSGDIESSFDSLKKQIQIAISMGMSGISWWTSDIGGFHSGDSTSQSFKELIIRWFQFSVFSPVLRMHGDRQPHTKRIGSTGGGIRTSGSSNEIWSFGEDVEKILIKFTRIRENLINYTYQLYQESNQYGYPIIRSLFFEFPNDYNCWKDKIAYMFGSDLIVFPITENKVKTIEVYLPEGTKWINVFDRKMYQGGNNYHIKVDLSTFPVFCREDSHLAKKLDNIFNLK